MNDSGHLFHGGDLLSASHDTGIPLENWIDLSTGISPYAYPTDDIPANIFSRLPYIDQAFKHSSKEYYGSEHFVALPGTQAAIQLIPKLLHKLPVLLPSVGYLEHQHAWLKSGNILDFYPAFDEAIALANIDQKLQQNPQQHLVIINPNNPSTLCFTPMQLLVWAEALGKDAYLIIDEAFIDTTPTHSVIPYLRTNTKNNIIILRSFGKFFGLAGIRLGFVFATPNILKQLEEQIPLWSINGPALYLASKAFTDRNWQTEHQVKLLESEQFTAELFKPLEHKTYFHQRLFSTYLLPKKLALTIFKRFYREGILLRLIEVSDKKSIIRVGRVRVDDMNATNKISLLLE